MTERGKAPKDNDLTHDERFSRGELLVSVASVAAAHLSDGGLEHRSLALKGKTETTDVVVLHVLA